MLKSRKFEDTRGNPAFLFGGDVMSLSGSLSLVMMNLDSVAPIHSSYSATPRFKFGLPTWPPVVFDASLQVYKEEKECYKNPTIICKRAKKVNVP